MSKNVRRDIAIGEVAEKRIISLLEEAGMSATKNSNHKLRSFFDIMFMFKKTSCTIESKYDLYASKSGNVAIEIFNPKTGKPSGLGITKADLWCHIVDEEIYCTTVAQLKDYTETHTPHKSVTAGGDQNATLLLYRIEDIMPAIFVRIDDLSKRELLDTLSELLGR